MQSQSEDIKDLVKSLVEVQGEIRDAEKTSKGQVGQQIYKYADLESVIDATREVFAKNGLVVSQLSGVHEGKMILITLLMHSSGQWLKSFMPVMNERNTAQSLGSGLTYARRYSLAAIAGITQTDDDGAAASEPVPQPPKPSGKPSPIKAAGPVENKQPFESYTIPGGVYKGMRFDQVAVVELANYIAKVEEAAKAKNEPLKGATLTMVAMAHKYLDSVGEM